ncbi:MAG: PAS domain S-box protein [Halobacteriovoraceae bacterium]|nr:PAS domain S-box protein [Halobacteriovoraceae bacterium]
MGITKVEDFFKNVRQPILITDNDATITFANPELSRLFGYENNELIGQNVETLIEYEKRQYHKQLVQNFMENKQYLSMGTRTVSGLKKDGEIIKIRINLNPWEFRGEESVVVFISDYSEAISKKNGLLELIHEVEVDSRLDYFLEHELKGPLTSLIALAKTSKNLKSHSEFREFKHLLDDIEQLLIEKNKIVCSRKDKIRKKFYDNLLVIDDSESIHKLFQSLAVKLGLESKIHFADDGDTGIELLKKYSGSKNLIMLDLNMPRVNGFEFLQHAPLQENDNVTIYSSSVHAKDISRAFEFPNVNNYIVKPLKTIEIKNNIFSQIKI